MMMMQSIYLRRTASRQCRRFMSSMPVAVERTTKFDTVVPQKTQKNILDQQQQQQRDVPVVSPSEMEHTEGTIMPITSHLKIFKDEVPSGTWPVFRLLDESGHFRDPAMDGYKMQKTASFVMKPQGSSGTETTTISPSLDLDETRRHLQTRYPQFEEEFEQNALLRKSSTPYADTNDTNPLLRSHRQMIRLRQMDKIFQNAQRQGRISFYMTCRGEEAIHMGAANALQDQDTIFAQYREAGLLMWRGFTLQQFADQCFSNAHDLGRGRQMPVHYGSRALNYHTVSSPLGTQLPQAVGAAYQLKLSSPGAAVAVCFFGDGCASTTDFHSALNFAATLSVPCIFVCRNNGYAISTPISDQYSGDGVVVRAHGYGMAGLRVDGNDVFAMAAAIRQARTYALKNSSPVLVEAMTYRQGHHSTSDDSTRYRSSKEVQDVSVHQDPIKRLERLLHMSAQEKSQIRDEEKMAVLQAMEQAERKAKPKLEYLFEDVYNEMPPHLERQYADLKQHISKYPDRYL